MGRCALVIARMSCAAHDNIVTAQNAANSIATKPLRRTFLKFCRESYRPPGGSNSFAIPEGRSGRLLFSALATFGKVLKANMEIATAHRNATEKTMYFIWPYIVRQAGTID